MRERIVATYTMLSTFRDCRKKYYWRYVRELVPLKRAQVLRFGTVVHELLDGYHAGIPVDIILAHVDSLYPDRVLDEEQRADWHLAKAMIYGYAKRYPREADDFTVVAQEHVFRGSIMNPATGRISRSFSMAGKVDFLAQYKHSSSSDCLIGEHKTTSEINEAYLDRLLVDLQIYLYALYIEETRGSPVREVVYNVLAKSRLRQGAGETEEEYQARREELIAKSKSGKTTAKRKTPETDEEFQARLRAWYEKPDAFHRHRLHVDGGQLRLVREELWEIALCLLEARRRNACYRNTNQCFQYGRCCPYFTLCCSGDNPNIVDNHYCKEAPHQELLEKPKWYEEPKPPIF